MKDKVNGYILKWSKWFLILTIIVWFMIGLLLGSLLEVIGLIGNSKYVNAFTVASLMSLVIGGYRGIRHLLRLDEHII